MVDGFRSSEETIHGLTVIFTQISTQIIAEHLGTQIGEYAAIHTGRLRALDNLVPAIECLAECIKRFLSPYQGKPLLIVGIGNADYDFDSLGPRVIQRIPVQSFSTIKMPCVFESVYTLAPGTTWQSNIRIEKVISGMVQTLNAGCVLLVDTACTSRLESMSATINLTTTGWKLEKIGAILNSETLGVPVLTIAVPLILEIPPTMITPLHLKTNKNGISLIDTDITKDSDAAVTIISNGILKFLYPKLNYEYWLT